MRPSVINLPVGERGRHPPLARRRRQQRGGGAPSKSKCRERLRTANRFVVAFYSNPVLTEGALRYGLRPLSALTREMRYLIEMMSPIDFLVFPATTWDHMQDAIQRYRPQVILWSGHTAAGDLIVETKEGLMDHKHYINASMLWALLEKVPTVKLVCLMGCETHRLVQQLKPTSSDCAFISWSTLTNDTPASVFTSGIVDSLQRSIDTNELVDASATFQEACRKFLEAGYRFGDPVPYMNQGIEVPPVEGDAVLTTNVDLVASDL